MIQRVNCGVRPKSINLEIMSSLDNTGVTVLQSVTLMMLRTTDPNFRFLRRSQVLLQGSQTRGPWTACGPPDVLIRPEISLKLLKLLLKFEV